MIVLSVDDNPMMGDAVKRMLTSVNGSTHAGHFLSGEGVVEAVLAEQPDVVLMDLDMPGTDTCSLIRELTRVAPDTRVLMLSGHLRRLDILDCLSAGAYGYVHKEKEPAYIFEAIRRVAAGEMVLCDDAVRVAELA
jgi:DNA-binding NarL/FixJ family response regulator